MMPRRAGVGWGILLGIVSLSVITWRAEALPAGISRAVEAINIHSALNDGWLIETLLIDPAAGFCPSDEPERGLCP